MLLLHQVSTCSKDVKICGITKVCPVKILWMKSHSVDVSLKILIYLFIYLYPFHQSIPLLRESHKKFVFVEDWNLPSLYGK